MGAVSRGTALVAAAIGVVATVAGCRVYLPPQPDPSVSTEINGLPPARARRSVPPSQPPMDHDQAWLVDEECSGCHTIARVDQARLDWDGWRGEVGHMVQNGAVLTVPEQQAIVDYLALRSRVMPAPGWPPPYPGWTSVASPTVSQGP